MGVFQDSFNQSWNEGYQAAKNGRPSKYLPGHRDNDTPAVAGYLAGYKQGQKERGP